MTIIVDNTCFTSFATVARHSLKKWPGIAHLPLLLLILFYTGINYFHISARICFGCIIYIIPPLTRDRKILILDLTSSAYVCMCVSWQMHTQLHTNTL